MDTPKTTNKLPAEPINPQTDEAPKTTVPQQIQQKISGLGTKFAFLQKINKKILIALAVIVVFGIGAGGYVAYQKVQKQSNEPASSTVQEETQASPEVGTTTPTSSQAPGAFTNSTPTPSSQPTSSGSTTPSCNYDLTSSTGSVKIAVQTQTGYLSTSFYGELKAATGCKVLDGKSTDIQTTYGSLNTKEIIFSSVPPGNYSVRAFVAGSWTNSQNVSVAAGQLSTINYSVTGDPAPTATPAPKPSCTTPVSIPSSGSAPLAVNLYIGYTGSGSSNDLTNIQWDFTGDGSWDVTIPYGNSYQYTYQSAGTYTLKGRIQDNSGTYSDPCQTTITVN